MDWLKDHTRARVDIYCLSVKITQLQEDYGLNKLQWSHKSAHIGDLSLHRHRAVITRMYVCKVLQVLQDQGFSPSI